MTTDTTVQMLVLNDEETCTAVEGSFAVQFENHEDAQDFSDYGMNRFHLHSTGETITVPLYTAVRK